MRISKTGTVRFAKVVEAAGRPEVVSLWTKPERDKSFMTAVRQNRVMTVKQETAGSAKDFGIVGFLRQKTVSYLVFPKPLKAFQDRRIVGIKYDLIETPGPIGRVIKPEQPPQRSRTRKVQPAEWQLEPERLETPASRARKRYRATIRFTSIAEVQEMIEAGSRKEAKELALKQAVMPDFRRGTVTRKVAKVAED
jgi:hypothetical protein